MAAELFFVLLFWLVPTIAVTWHAHAVGRTKLWGLLTALAPLIGVLLYIIMGSENR